MSGKRQTKAMPLRLIDIGKVEGAPSTAILFGADNINDMQG